jgi:hypothetical protein
MNMVATKQLPDSDPRKFAFDKYAVACREMERMEVADVVGGGGEGEEDWDGKFVEFNDLQVAGGE